ncbi:MAG: hypothetical protein ACLPPV_24515 [Candidatus Korobacteraceae bacterium]|jgi:hypothetical protein
MPEKLTRLGHVVGASKAACNPRMRPHLLLLMSLLFAMPSFAQQPVAIQTGLPINFTTLTLHVSGQPITVYEFTVSIYPMNTPPPWPAGLWLYYYVQADAGGGANKSTWGQGQWCRWWIYQVAALEQQNPQQLPYPYFQINLPTTVPQIETDENIPVYPAGSVTCWQANNDFAP